MTVPSDTERILSAEEAGEAPACVRDVVHGKGSFCPEHGRQK